MTLRLDVYQERLDVIVGHISDIDIRDYELADAETIAAGLKVRAHDLIEAARGVLGEVLDTCEQLEAANGDLQGTDSVRDSYLSFDQALDSSVARSPRDVGEIGFIANLELSQRLERLRRANPARGSASLLAECDGALRRARRALSAVDSAIAAAEGTEPRVPFTSILESSLAVRRAYAKFRRSLDRRALASAPLHQRFRSAGTQIAMVIGWSVYPEMRVGDRLLLRGLQQRILAWLRAPDATPVDGERLWQDLVGFLEMLSLVNRRQEQVDHDRDALERLGRRLGEATSDLEIAESLAPLAGLDDELDSLAAGRPLDRPRLGAATDRLRLGHLGAGQF